MLITSPSFSTTDAKHMAHALRLAEQGKYSTTPNPQVGCVIVDANGNVVGEGFHQKAGLAHAEINALEQAGAKANLATAYVTLEPCAHYGKTGPCALALIKAKVAKVIVACVDSNPEVSGKGVDMLVKAGIDVAIGLMKEAAYNVNRKFFHRLSAHRPFVTVKLAASIDGKTALATGESKWITSNAARKDVQVFRATACAILSGTDTIIADDPQLNVRPQELPSGIAEKFSWRLQQPLRVIVDSQNRLDDSYQIFNDGQATLVYNLAYNVNIDANNKSIEQKQLDSLLIKERKFVSLNALLLDLAKRGVNHLWVEAGASLSGALFDLGVVDELVLYQAPKLLGASAKGLSDITSPVRLADARQGKVMDTQIVGNDTRMRIEFGDINN